LKKTISFMFAGSSSAAWTGNDLYRFLSSGSAQWGLGLGYVAGQLDNNQASGSATDDATPYPVKIEGVTYEQASDVVLNYLRENPETRHRNAALLVRQAFASAWSPNSTIENTSRKGITDSA
jgi:hypothetical protein